MLKHALILFLVGFTCFRAEALVELSVHAGGAIIDPEELNSSLSQSQIKQIYVFPNIGGEAALYLPMTPVGLGVRYDYGALKVNAATGSNANSEAELLVGRLAVQGHLRMLNLPTTYLGLTGGVGVSHSLNSKFKVSGVDTNFDDAKGSSFTIGLESGLKIASVLRVGGEAGYQYFVLTDIKGPSGNASFTKINLSGFYLLGVVGIGF